MAELKDTILGVKLVKLQFYIFKASAYFCMYVFCLRKYIRESHHKEILFCVKHYFAESFVYLSSTIRVEENTICEIRTNNVSHMNALEL